LYLALVLIAQSVAATPTPEPTPVPTRDPRPISVRRAEEFPGTFVLHYREWKQFGSIMLSVNYRPDAEQSVGLLRVTGTVDLNKGWRWLESHQLECVADGARLPLEAEYDGQVEDGYLAESVVATVPRAVLKMIAKAEKAECSIGPTQVETDPKRRGGLLKEIGN